MPRQDQIWSIDYQAITRNWQRICDFVKPGCEVFGVVKDNAYGLGVGQTARALDNAGCPAFFVQDLAAGIELRKVTQKPIYIFNGVWREDSQLAIDHDLRPVLSNLRDIENWNAQSQKAGRKLPAIIQLETGMNRLGLSDEEWAGCSDILFQADYIMSHLACADRPDHPKNLDQRTQFLSMVASNTHQTRLSLSASAGLLHGPDMQFDMVRPGIGLYGGNPVENHDLKGEAVAFLQARILHVNEIKQGETVGYGASWTAARPSRIGTVAIGYAHGLHRSLSNRGGLYWHGNRCPLVGRISMDMCVVDMTDLETHGSPLPQAGDLMEVLGHAQTIDAMAKDASTISYEILTSFGHAFRA